MVARVTAIFPKASMPNDGKWRLCLWYRRLNGTPDSLTPEPAPCQSPCSDHLSEGYEFAATEDAIAFRRRTLSIFGDGTNLGDGLPFQVIIEGDAIDVPRAVCGIMASRIAYE